MRFRVECWRGDAPHQRMLQSVATRVSAGKPAALQGVTIEQTLRRLSAESARKCYADLCEIDAAVREHRRPVLRDLKLAFAWDDPGAVRRFHRTVIDRGLLVDRLMDCIDEPDVARRQERWRSARKSHCDAVTAQRQLAHRQFKWSAFLAKSREANARAYETLRHASEHNLLHLDIDDLARLPPTFWATISLRNCTLDEQRALVHKLERCRALSPCCDELLHRLRLSLYNRELTPADVECTESAADRGRRTPRTIFAPQPPHSTTGARAGATAINAAANDDESCK